MHGGKGNLLLGSERVGGRRFKGGRPEVLVVFRAEQLSGDAEPRARAADRASEQRFDARGARAALPGKQADGRGPA